MDLSYLSLMSEDLSRPEEWVASLPQPSLLEFGVEGPPDGDPSVRVASALWRGIGSDVIMTTSLAARYRPVWWPESVPFCGPEDDVEHLRRLGLTARLLFRETEMFSGLTGDPWMDCSVDSRFCFREWRRSQAGLWSGYARAGDGLPQSDRAWGEAVVARPWVPNGSGSFHVRHLPLKGLSDGDLELVEDALDRWGASADADWWTAYPYAVAAAVMEG